MEEFRVIVAGGRKFKDYDRLRLALDKVLVKYDNVTIISGGATGADYLAERYAKERELNLQVFPAKWGKYGKQAGPIRNSEMISTGKPQALVAFWNGVSTGTKDMIKKAEAKDLKIRLIRY